MTEARRKLLILEPLSKLKKTAWEVFSEYIRVKNSNEFGYVTCVSCGKYIPWKQAQAGHWPDVAGRTNAVLYEEKVVWPQCYRCNIPLHGNPAGYGYFMRKTYDEEQLEGFRRMRRQAVRFEKSDLIAMIEKWTDAIRLKG